MIRQSGTAKPPELASARHAASCYRLTRPLSHATTAQRLRSPVIATINSVPRALRVHASKIPPAILNKLTAAEAKLRVQHVAELHESASKCPAEHARLLIRKSQQVLRSMPAREFIDQRRKLRMLAATSDSTVGREEGKPVPSVSTIYHLAASKLQDDNHYPPGLIDKVESCLTDGKGIHPAEAADIAEIANG